MLHYCTSKVHKFYSQLKPPIKNADMLIDILTLRHKHPSECPYIPKYVIHLTILVFVNNEKLRNMILYWLI